MLQEYWRVPMHPLWQPLQATKLPLSEYVINWNNVFGGATSVRCWWSISSLMLWIAEHVYGIEDLCDCTSLYANVYCPALVVTPKKSHQSESYKSDCEST